MSLVLEKDTEVAIVLFLEIEGGNVLGHVTRQPGEEWELVYRFRYYRDRKVHDSADEKSFYGYRLPKENEGAGDPEQAAQALRMVFEMTRKRFGIEGKEVEVVAENCGGEEAMLAVMAQPWANPRGIGRGEA